MDERVLITGNTYQVKDQLKALGGRRDSAAKGWWVPAAKAGSAARLVSSNAAQPRFSAPRYAPPPAVVRRGGCRNPRDCGDPTCQGECGY